ncbi:MAG: phosphoglycerate mutase, partial [Ruminiclostridium sp.]|nr:phosphoglycerate mutase [Ruminiclostridium sp.]
MKYVVLLCDGMADLYREDLNGTPMSVANKPNMDMLCKKSRIGLVKTVADNLKPGSDVANLSVLGYDPAIYYSGRSPLEAGSIGI